MKVTCPSIGIGTIVLRIFFLETGVDFIEPASNEGAEEHEAFNEAPEDMCLPFKLFLVQLEKAWEKGADTVVMPSSKGPCRMGEFCELLKSILDRRGCSYKWIILDVPSEIGMREFVRRFLSMFGKDVKLSSIVRAARSSYHLIKRVERLEADVRLNAGYFKEPREGSRLIAECHRELTQAAGFDEAFDIVGRARWKLGRIPRDLSKRPVKIILTGEIFSQSEPYASRGIEDRISDMGVCFEKDVSLSWWMRFTASGRFGLWASERLAPGRKYLPYNIGGYTRRTVATVDSSRDMGFEGVVQIMPAGCMPEIVGHAAIDKISEDKGINTLSLVYDEMSGEAGYMTRLEAFFDMLERKR